jgi:hypothetical protein
MAVPDRPDPDDIVASAWGDWVHDRQLNADVQLLARLGAAQTIVTDSTFVVAAFDSTPVNVGAHWNPGTHQWTAPRTGTIEVTASIQTTAAAPAAGTQVGHIGSAFIGGTEYRLGQTIAAQVAAATACGIVILPVGAGQLIDARGYVTAPGLAKTIGAGSWLAIRYVA